MEETWSHLTNWRLVSGVRFPFRQESIAKQAAENQLIEWDRIAPNTATPDDIFARPGTDRVPIRIASGRTETDWFPVDLYLRSYLFLRGTVNGVETDFVLDSGAGMTVLDSTFAKKLGLQAEGVVAAKGARGNSTAGVVSGISLHAAGLVADSLTVVVIDLSGVSRMLGRPLPVVFGNGVFNNLIVDLDYPKSRIRFCDPASFRYQGLGHAVPLHQREGGHRDVEAQIESLPPAQFHLDTGNGGTLDVFPYYVAENRLAEGRTPSSRGLSGGVGGRTTVQITTLRALTIGGYTLSGVPVSFPPASGGASDTRREAGNLGASILSRFRVLFDFTHDRLYLEPGAGWDTAPFRKDRGGLSLQLGDGRLDVQFVAPGSPAEKTGWKEGDAIVAVNGRPIERDRYMTDMSGWNEGPAGTEVLLRLAGGDERRLRLQDYY
jgi:hypothetical protein